jgi:hypothetical protein
MVTKKGGNIGGDLGGIKPPGDLGGIIPIRPKPKPWKAKMFGYKVLRVENGLYVSAIESKKEMQMDYGISMSTAKEMATIAAKEAGFEDKEISMAIKTLETELVDTTIEYATPDGVQRLLVFDSIKNAKAFQRLIKGETEIWLCEVTDPKHQKHLLLFPTPENSVSFWEAMTSIIEYGIYNVLPRSTKLFFAPPGTLAVSSLKLISKITK